MQLTRGYLPVNWLSFGLMVVLVGGILGAFVWVMFLRGPLGHYVPPRLRRVLLVPPMPVMPV